MYLNDPLLGPRIFDVSIEPLNTAFPKIDKILENFFYISHLPYKIAKRMQWLN